MAQPARLLAVVLCAVALLRARCACGTAGVVYAPLTLWPYPHNVSLPASVGPRIVPPAGAFHVRYTACRDEKVLAARLAEALGGRTTYRATLRVFDEQPYVRRDAACGAQRCCSDADCGGALL